MTLSAFQTKRLVVKVRRNVVLNRISVVGAPGQLLCILSRPSGDARILLQTLAGLRKPASGQLQVLGGNPRSSRVRSQLGLSLPLHLLDPEPSTSDALREVGRIKGLGKRDTELGIQKLIHQLGLHAIADECVATLSAADQQLLGTAVAFLGNPALILLDRDCALWSEARQQALIQLLKARTERGATIILTDVRFAGHCDEVILLSDGALIGQASPETIRDCVIGLEIATAASSDSHKPQPQEPTLAEICQWIIEHPTEMATRARRWTVPEATPGARG